ncbi:hypothetical protein As57867_006151, partial [Aphanomyces stellatus]
MKTTFLALSTTATLSMATRMAFTQLDTTQQSDIQQKLVKWKTLYGSVALANGFVPPATESLDEDAHSQDELERFHNTILEVEEASRLNPGATFSEFNQFALLTTDEFKNVLQRSFGDQNTTQGAPLAYESLDVSADAPIDWSTSKCNPPVKNQGS